MATPNLTNASSSSHKRIHSGTIEGPIAKRPNQNIPQALVSRYVYLVMWETSGPYIDTESGCLGVYESLQDAIWKIKSDIIEDYGEFNDDNTKDVSIRSDMDGLFCGRAEDGEGGESNLWVRKMEVKAPGSEQDSEGAQQERDSLREQQQDEEEASKGQDEEEEEEEEEHRDESDNEGDNESDEDAAESEEDDEDPLLDIKRDQEEARRKSLKGKSCGGAGCGDSLCESCWPQTAEDWEVFS